MDEPKQTPGTGKWMTVREDAARLLLQGLSPRQIATKMGKDLIDIKRFLLTQVGEGTLRLSDILFSIDEKTRESFEAIAREHPGESHPKISQELRRKKLTVGEYRIYLACRNSERGDMYVYLADIELTLHDLIKRALTYHFGKDKWWRGGIPTQIRTECASAQQQDADPVDDLFGYTTLINLSEILKKNWGLFVPLLPKTFVQNRSSFLGDLHRLNTLRNGIMHPIKRIVISKDDFAFVRKVREQIDESNWRFKH